MTTNKFSEQFSLAELDILMAHLRLGNEHLKAHLDSGELSRLLNSCAPDRRKTIAVSTNWIEKSGNVALVINTVITSIFGAWMGFHGFLELELNSFFILGIVTLTAILTSFIVGSFNFRLTKNLAANALHNLKLINLQHILLKQIIQKQQEKLRILINNLNKAIYRIEEDLISDDSSNIKQSDYLIFDFENDLDYNLWFARIKNALSLKIGYINAHKIYHHHSQLLLQTLEKITEIIENIQLSAASQSALQKNINIPKIKDSKLFIHLLLFSPYNNSDDLNHEKNWFGSNYLALLAGLFPTLLGCFASMFVFLSGGPDMIKQLGLHALEQMLREPGARFVEFFLAASLTLYYGSSFLYNNYKNFHRDEQLDSAKKEMYLLENEDIFLKRKISVMTSLKARVDEIINIYNSIANIQKFDTTRQQKELA